jgi:putative ABC transport system permease protein
MIDIARKILLHDKLRLVITVSGVAFAVTLVCVQVGLFLGLLSSSTVTIERAEADLWVTSKNTANVDFAIPFSENFVQRVRSVAGVERADNLIVWFQQINLPTGATESVLLYGLEHFARWRLPWNVVEGNPEDLRRGDFIMLDQSAMKRYGPFATGDFREVGKKRVKIIGITREAKSFTTTPMAFMDYHRIQSLDPVTLGGQTTYMLVKLAPGANAMDVRDEIQRRLPYHDVHLRDNWAQKSRNYWITSTGLGMNMGLTVFLGCLVGIVVVAQTLYTSVMDHFKEFATVKAIGGSNGAIYRIIAKQAVIAAVLGFAAGAGVALSLRPILAAVDLKMLLQPGFFGVVLVGTVGLCLAASAISFRKIASMDPALVFRS